MDVEPSLILRVDEKSEGLLDLYKSTRSHSCAFVTACNPFGKLFGDADNARLQGALADHLRPRGLHFLTGEGKHPVGDWPGEPSFLVFGLTLEAARGLGNMFSQNAIIWCDADAIPRLILLKE